MPLVLDNEVRPEERFLGPELARRLDADYHVYPDDPIETLPADLDALVVAGSSAGTYEDHAWIPTEEALIREAIDREVPTLGVCFGHQLVNQALGGRVEPMDAPHAGFFDLREYDDAEGLFEGVRPPVPALNGDRVVELGEGLGVIAKADHDAHFATRHESAPLWTVQFHPECRPEDAEYYDVWDEPRSAWEGANAGRVLENFRAMVDR